MVAKKTAAKSVAKKPTKKPLKKVASKKRSTTKKPAEMQSFRVYKDTQPFTRIGFSRQTIYWSILLAFIIVTQLWILKIQLDIANLTALLAN
ncbi:hypothetical protein H7100_00375 [Candidatus Saccharibacteria bacterium]|nr:hypothetical protein [Candidatus Saccharibacteria bacterium]